MTRIHGAAAEGYDYDGTNFTDADGKVLTDDEVKKLGLTYVKYEVETPDEGRALRTEYKAYYVAHNDFTRTRTRTALRRRA